jgi:hypothetical protein
MSQDEFVPSNCHAIVAALHEQMRREKKKLEQRVERGDLSARQFAKEINSILNSILKEASTLLTPEEFEQAFGFRYSGQKTTLVDPGVAAASAKAK